MNDVLRALGIAAGILFPVVCAIVLISIAVVKRGELSGIDGHGVPDDSFHVKEASAPAAAKGGKPAAAASDEINVAQILILGTGLFVLMILLLLALSLIEHGI
jgi:hypothetical protein